MPWPFELRCSKTKYIEVQSLILVFAYAIDADILLFVLKVMW